MTLREEENPPVWIPSNMKGGFVNTSWSSKDHDTISF
jgi:hypothetical protein